LRRAVDGAPDAKIVEHDASPAERHVPVVGLMKVVMQPDDATRGTIGTIRLDHLATARNPFATVRLDEQSAPVTVDRRDHVEDARDELALRDRCHRYSRSAREWSPSIRRVAFGRSPLRTTSTSRPSRES